MRFPHPAATTKRRLHKSTNKCIIHGKRFLFHVLMIIVVNIFKCYWMYTFTYHLFNVEGSSLNIEFQRRNHYQVCFNVLLPRTVGYTW